MDNSLDNVKLSVKKLAKKFSFVDNVIWSGLENPITREEIDRELNLAQQNPYAYTAMVPMKPQNGRITFDLEGENCRIYHANRIAYLVDFKADDAISIDVGIPRLGCLVSWVIVDGNHRLAAAIVRGDEFINASFSGELGEVRRFIEKYGA